MIEAERERGHISLYSVSHINLLTIGKQSAKIIVINILGLFSRNLVTK